MKTYRILLCAIGLVIATARVDASTLYGSTSAGGAGELWILDPTTGASIQDVGPIDDAAGANYAVTGLAFDPITGVLYGSTGNASGQKLLTINPATAVATVVGSFNAGTGNTMADISFDPSGNLYGIGSSGGANLFSVNITTAQATKIGSSGFGGTAGGGLAISPGGVFYSTPEGNDLGTYDPTTGAYTFIATLPTPAGTNTSYASLAFDGNTLYGMDLGSPPHLLTITPTGGTTDLGASVSRIDGIAFSVPEPGAISLFLAASALTLTRSRRKNIAR